MVMNDCDKERGKKQLIERSPFFEYSICVKSQNTKLTEILCRFPYLTPEDSDQVINRIHSLQNIEEMPSPRVIKTHLPLYLLHPNLLDTCKVLKQLI